MSGEIYLSASAEESSRSKLFRPKEITEIVFPGISMIMYNLFWVKYIIYLEREGYNIHSQNHLFLWAEKEGVKEPTEGVLYYSILSEYLLERGEIEESVSAGSDASKNWIFQSQSESGYNQYESVRDGLLVAIDEPQEFDVENFVKENFSSEFRGKCAESEIEPAHRIEKRLRDISVDRSAPERERFEAALSAFVEGLADLFKNDRYGRLHRKRNENIIGPNINFTTTLIDEVGMSRLEPLANTELGFDESEIAALIEAIQNKKDGEYLVGSFLIMSYLIEVHGGDIRSELRRIYEVYQNEDDFVEKAQRQLPSVSFSSEVVERLESLCFYWKVNFFLADGEDISRSNIDEVEIIKRDEVELWMEESDKAQHFTGFIRDLNEKGWLDELEKLVVKMEEKGEEDIAEFFEILHEGVGANKSPTDIYLDLLEQRDTVAKEAKDTYKVEFEPDTSDSAGFYGIGALTTWTETILRYQ